MSEYISRNEAYQKLHEAGGCDASDEWARGYDAGITVAIDIIDNIPPADVVPVVHGKWVTKSKRIVDKETGETKQHYIWNECSKCRKHNQSKSNYCPHCGAKMGESEVKDEEKSNACF